MYKETAIILSILFFLCTSVTRNSVADDGYFISLYGGQVSDTPFHAIIRGNVDYKDYYLIALSFGKELFVYKDSIGVEMEGQVVKHINGTEHWEANPVLTLRWLPFPWDDKVDTSFAWGNGISFASEKPEFEMEESSKDDRTSQVLYYFMVEIEFEFQKIENWGVFSRIHHRSSVFGLIDGLQTGSNYLTIGVRYRF